MRVARISKTPLVKCDRSVRDKALPVHVRILKIFSEGGEGPAFRPGWVQIKTVENRRGSGPPLPTPSGSAHDVGDNISNQMTTGVMVKNQYEILLSAVFICTICTWCKFAPGCKFTLGYEFAAPCVTFICPYVPRFDLNFNIRFSVLRINSMC